MLLVLVGLSVLLLVLVGCWRWVASVIRLVGIVRLGHVGAEEAESAQIECSAGTSDGSGRRPCVVCYCATATWCSRCKVVRYCSGKCQVVHWRQGHKEECPPPPFDDSEIKISSPAEQLDSSDYSLDVDVKEYTNPYETLFKRSILSESNKSSELFSEDDSLDCKHPINKSGTENSSATSSPSTFSSLVEAFDDAGISGIHNIPPDSSRPVIEAGKVESAKLSSSQCEELIFFPYDLFAKLYKSDKVDLQPCGLTNCGNSCYANAVLQCLAFTHPLTAYFLEGLHTKTCLKKGWCFTCEFESLVLKVKQGKSPISPIGIISQINNIGKNLGHGREEDAHEFLRYAIDTMQSVCLNDGGTNVVDLIAAETTLIQLIFGGYLQSKIRCMRCLGKSKRYERIMDLTVEIYGGIRTLEEALARFTTTEILEGENKYFCNRCESYERAKKKLTILEAPNVLTIALKRYQFGKFGKTNKTVKFPEYLNLAPYMKGTQDKSPVYGLYAVVVHLDIMNASISGHYVCYVKNAGGKWYEINDSVVKPVELQKVLKKDAYMLFYARCSPRAPNLLKKAESQDHENIKNHSEAPPTHVEESQLRKPRSVFIKNNHSEAPTHVEELPMRRPRCMSMSSLNSSKNYSNRFLPLQSDNGVDDFDSGVSFDKGSHNSRPNYFRETAKDSFRTSDHSDFKRNNPLRLSKARRS